MRDKIGLITSNPYAEQYMDETCIEVFDATGAYRGSIAVSRADAAAVTVAINNAITSGFARIRK